MIARLRTATARVGRRGDAKVCTIPGMRGRQCRFERAWNRWRVNTDWWRSRRSSSECHSCAPNSVIRGRRVLATHRIAAGEEIRFDYNTTEYGLSSPFPCNCGACDGGRVLGWRHLSLAERSRRSPWTTEHLLSLPDFIAPVREPD
jgi:hypothetical protein